MKIITKSYLLLLVIATTWLNTNSVQSVTPTYWENYMSFKIGNYFEYEYNGGLYRYSRKIVGDTIAQSNGQHYYKIENRIPITSNPYYLFERIDTAGNWYLFYGSSGECFLYRLDIPLNTSFLFRCTTNNKSLIDTFNMQGILGDIGPFQARKYHLDGLAQQDDYIARKYQLYYLYNYEGGNYAHLVGAIIDSVIYGSISGILKKKIEIPTDYKLYQNYPNPFNPKTNITFQIPKISDVKIKVFDILGREIYILINERLKTGTYSIDFDGANLSSGIYFYSLITNDYRETKKMIIIK